MEAMKRPVGRPRKHPVEEDVVLPERVIIIKSRSVTIATHHRVPHGWTVDEILRRYGIDRHLTVFERIGNDVRTIQPYEEWPRER